MQVIEKAGDVPAAIYIDANLRNFLIDGHRVFTVDHDCLTLVPFGYDLAKLVVSMAMTHGPLPSPPIAEALAAYNQSLSSPSHRLHEVQWCELMAWTEVHHILTNPTWDVTSTAMAGRIAAPLR